MDIGQKIKKIRKEKNITQRELGERMGVSQQQIAQYENGKLKPKLETICRIADALEISHNTLFNAMDPHEKGVLLKYDLIELVKNLNIEVTDITDSNSIINAVEETANKKRKYIKLYDFLNSPGQDKAIEQVELLTKIPEYQKKNE